MASERLLKLINDTLTLKGARALVDRSGVSEPTINQIANGCRTPRRRTAFKLALACGLGEEEALQMARECASLRAKKAG